MYGGYAVWCSMYEYTAYLTHSRDNKTWLSRGILLLLLRKKRVSFSSNKKRYVKATAAKNYYYIELWGASKNRKSFFFFLFFLFMQKNSSHNQRWCQDWIHSTVRKLSVRQCLYLFHVSMLYIKTNLLWLVYLFSQPWYRHLNKIK